MTDTVAILGANGVYGSHLTPRLVAAGYRVRALVRRPEAAAVARACGAEIQIADIFDADSLRRGLADCRVAINLATSLPRPGGTGDFDANDRVRMEGTRLWMTACEGAGMERVLQQSIAMVNAAGEVLADEDTVCDIDNDEVAARAISSALAMEEVVRQSPLDWAILRGGLFYGPGTGFDEHWFYRAESGKLRLPADGSSFVSLVHVADMANATVKALSRWPSRRALIVSDDRPVQWKDLFGYVAELAGAAAPEPGGRLAFPSFRVSNRRAREALDWAPLYSDYRAGLVR